MSLVRKPAPSFSADAVVPGGDFKTVRLEDYKGKYLVLFFYPLDWTFVCPTEICQFSDRVGEFNAIGAEVCMPMCRFDRLRGGFLCSLRPAAPLSKRSE